MKHLGRSVLNVGFVVGFIAGIMTSMLFFQTIRTSPKDGLNPEPGHRHDHSHGEGAVFSGNGNGYPVTPRPPYGSVNHDDNDDDDDVHKHEHANVIKDHKDVDKMLQDNKNVALHDQHQHQDNTELADTLVKSVRILCWVMTSPENHKKRAKPIQETWGKRCDKLLFASEKDDPNLPILEVRVEGGREHLTAKTMQAFDHVFEHHFNEADWFMKADDDTFVVVENLRYFLSSQNSSQPIFFGHHFKVIVAQGYFSGGGGYVLSKEALRRFGMRGKNTCSDDHGAEDVEMGRCMEKLGVAAGDSRDALGRSRFHCFNPETHIMGGYPDWYRSYDKYGAKHGLENVSDYAITFHYVDVSQLYGLEYYIYHLRPYGRINGPENLNRNESVDTTKT